MVLYIYVVRSYILSSFVVVVVDVVLVYFYMDDDINFLLHVDLV